MSVVFRFADANVSMEVEGPEEFVLPHVEFLSPFVRRATGAAGDSPPATAGLPAPGPAAEGIDGVAAWWARSVPAGLQPSVQDTLLLFAYYMRSFRKTVFVSEDLRRCFQVTGLEEPRSLLQILGTLRRDHGLLLNAGKRGEYMMNTTGIARAREILGERRPEAASPSPAPAPAAASPAEESRFPVGRSIFQD